MHKQEKESTQNETMPLSRTRKRRSRTKINKLRFTLFLIMIAVLLVLVYRCSFSKPHQAADISSDSSSTTQNTKKHVSAKESDSDKRKQDFYTILVSGEDDGNGGSDTNILMAFDAKNHSIHCVSIPRDTGAFINGKVRKINSAYNKGGAEELAETVSDLLGIPVDHTIEVDLNGFAALVDTIGGVDFDVPIPMDYDDPYQDLSIHFDEGMQHLNGEESLEVMRFRHNNDGSGYGSEDLGRIGTQQAFLKDVAKQTLSISNADKVVQLAKIFQKYVDTDLKLNNLTWLGKEAVSIGADNITFSTLEGEWDSPYYRLDRDAVLKQVNDYLNPYEVDRTIEDLNVPS